MSHDWALCDRVKPEYDSRLIHTWSKWECLNCGAKTPWSEAGPSDSAPVHRTPEGALMTYTQLSRPSGTAMSCEEAVVETVHGL